MLKGVKVLDLSRVLAGPYATQYLGDLGATIFKVEKPGVGDDTRSWYPPFSNDANLSAYFMCCNRNKKSVTVNISHPTGQDILRELVSQCDVMIENYQVGKLKEYGLDYESIKKIKPDIIYVSITGYGQNGSKKDLPGYDFIVQGESGLMSITGEETPMKVGVAISDVMTGMHAVNGILSSLIYRGQTGKGQHIDLSLFDSSLSYLVNQGMNFMVSNKSPIRRGNSHPNICPYELFKTNDDPIIIAVGNDKQFAEFCLVIGLEYEEKYKKNHDRVKLRTELAPKIEKQLLQANRDEWIQRLNEKNIPCGKVNTIQQAFQEPQVQERDMVWNVDISGKSIPTIGNPLRFSETKIENDTHLAPPQLGQHTDEVLREYLKKPSDIIAKWREGGII